MSREQFAAPAGFSYPLEITEDVLGYIRYDAYDYNYRSGGKTTPYFHANLHMPAEISDTLTTEWADETDVVSKGASALKVASSGTAAVSKFGKDMYTGDAGRSNTLKTGGDQVLKTLKQAPDLALRGMGGIASGFGIDSLEDLSKSLMRREGRVVNPHQEQFFTGVGFREFTFTHKLIAFSKKESEAIREIIYRFRYHSAPEFSQSSWYMKYPQVFEIAFMEGTTLSGYLPFMFTAVLKSVGVNYAGSGTWSKFESTGAPTDIELSLEFSETVLPTKEAIGVEREKVWSGDLSKTGQTEIIKKHDQDTKGRIRAIADEFIEDFKNNPADMGEQGTGGETKTE